MPIFEVCSQVVFDLICGLLLQNMLDGWKAFFAEEGLLKLDTSVVDKAIEE